MLNEVDLVIQNFLKNLLNGNKIQRNTQIENGTLGD